MIAKMDWRCPPSPSSIQGEREVTLKEIVDHQANMNVWTDTNKASTLMEEILQLMLRHLHAVIEGDEVMAQMCKKQYWDMESEL